MSKKKAFLVFLSLLTILVYAALIVDIVAYQMWKQQVASEAEKKYWWVNPEYLDFYPYHMTLRGKILLAAAFADVVLWLAYLSVRFRRRKVALASALASIILISTTFNIPASGDSTVHVNVFAVIDDEIIERELVEETCTVYDMLNESWKEQFRVEFHVKYGIGLHTEKTYTSTLELLDVAIKAFGWHPHMESPYGDTLHLLIFISGEPNLDMHGFSSPCQRAIIVKWLGVDKTFKALNHELGHQYLLPHCSNWQCYMNAEWCLDFGNGFCDNCKNKILENPAFILEIIDCPHRHGHGGGGGQFPIIGGRIY
ncbi:MAG TPA: hypothetical protein ENG10_04060 [Candidatus Bathyarchaeota archaeon]|nr:hypothetical protein [Candidatus Bathyarchaeota archaeon]HEX69450.1 hypothetical protein [Candidatus Bathyarchaeota archaeon]